MPEQEGLLQNVAIATFNPVEVNNIDQLADELRRSLEGVSGIKILKESRITFGGMDGYKIVNTQTYFLDDSKYKNWLISTVFNEGSTSITLSIQAEETMFDKNKGQFERLVQSFKIEPPQISQGYRLQAVDEVGFTFEYPEDWIKVVEGHDRIYIDAPIKGSLLHSVSIALTRSNETKNLDDVADDIVKSFEQADSVTILNNQRVNWAGKEAIEIRWQQEVWGDTQEGWQISAVPQEGILLALTMLSPDSETFTDQQTGFQHIISSSKFT